MMMESNSTNIKKPIIIAVVDSGIDTSKADLERFVKKTTGYKVNDNGYIAEHTDMEVKNEHGTAIAMIIKQICSNVEFISINILNERLAADGRVLIHALRQSLLLKPDIIHLSLGTTRWKHFLPLKRIVRAASKKDIIIVSSANNEGHVSYPAYLKGVVGVKGRLPMGIQDLYYDGKFFIAPAGLYGIEGADELTTNKAVGSSMAAAYVSGHIANIISQNKLSDSSEIKKVLLDKAKILN